MLKNYHSQYSPLFDTVKLARKWAYNQPLYGIWFLIHDREENKYQLVNESRLGYLRDCWDLDMSIIETWE